MATSDLIQTACLLTRDQHARLKQLSQRTHVSMSLYLRMAVDRLLAEQTRKGSGRREAIP